MADVQWLTAREERAWRALQFMQLRLEGELARQLAISSGLSYPDYVVLVALTDSEEGRLRMFELADALGWERSRASHQVTRMVGRGLVAKEKSGSDGRGAYVAVTERGQKEIAAAAPGHVALVRQAFIDRLTAEQLDVIAEIAESVMDGLDEIAQG